MRWSVHFFHAFGLTALTALLIKVTAHEIKESRKCVSESSFKLKTSSSFSLLLGQLFMRFRYECL